MRFYDLQTTVSTGTSGPNGSYPDGSGTGVAARWTSFPNGSYDPEALDVNFDAQVTPGHTPGGGTVVSVAGVSQHDLFQAKNFAGSAFALYAGMSGGLPLSANQPAPGLLFRGSVFGAFGNWQGTEQTLDLLIIPSTYTQENPGNIVLNWKPGQSFSDAIIQTLTVAYPGADLKVSVAAGLVNTTGSAVLNINSTFNGLAHFVNRHTDGLLGPNYPGVSLYHTGSKIIIADHTQPAEKTIALKFNDLIGQPTWLEPPTLTINTMLRADIEINDYITLPAGDIAGPGSVTTLATQHAASLRNTLTFNGSFVVTAIRHVGEFRGTDAGDWLSVIQAVPAGVYKAS